MTSHPSSSLQKIALVTGATSGIGHVSALELAGRGSRVLIIARNAVKGQQVLNEIAVQTGNSALELLVGDLSNMSDVRRIAWRHASITRNSISLFTTQVGCSPSAPPPWTASSTPSP